MTGSGDRGLKVAVMGDVADRIKRRRRRARQEETGYEDSANLHERKKRQHVQVEERNGAVAGTGACLQKPLALVDERL